MKKEDATMKLIQRFISSWLAVCLVLSMLPVQALATDKPEAEPMAAETAMTEPDAESIPTEPEISEPTEESVPEPKETDEPAVPMEEVQGTEAAEVVTEEIITETVSHVASDVADAENDNDAVDVVAELINNLPALEEIQKNPLNEQQADYFQVQAAYDAYESLTDDQKSLMSSAEETFGAYFDYFNTACTILPPVNTSTPWMKRKRLP